MIARRSTLVVVNSIIGGILGYAALLAMARYMGDDLLGARAYVLSIVFLLGLVTRLGFPTTHARRLARGDDVPGSNGTYLVIKLILTGAFIVIAGGGMLVWFHLLGKPATDVTEKALWLGIAIVLFKSLRDYLTNTFRGLDMIVRRETGLLVNTVVTVTLTVLAAVAYAWSHGRWTPLPGFSAWVAELYGAVGPASHVQALAWLLGAYLIGEIVAFVVALGLFVSGRIPIGKPSMDIARSYREATVPIMFVTIAGLLMRRVDEVMIGFWHSSAQLGHYAAATKMTEAVLILANGISVALLPLIARLQKQGREDDLRRVLAATERWISILVWPVVVLGIVATRPIIHIVLSDQFLPAATILVLLLLHSFSNSLTIPLRTKALGMGKQGFAAKVATQALGINIVANIFLIPRYSGVGASVATLMAGAYMMLRYRTRAHTWTGHAVWPRYLTLHAIAAAGAGGITWWVMRIGPAIDRFYDLLWLGPMVLLIYGALLYGLGALHRGDWHEFRAMLGGKSPKGDEEVSRL